MQSKRIVITGGGGFIGSHLCQFLLEKGFSVIAVDNFLTGRFRNIANLMGNPGFTLITCDITRKEELLSVMGEVRADAVVHLAAIPSVPRSLEFPYNTFSVNVNGTLNVVESMRLSGTRILIHISSSSVYGNSPEKVRSEDMMPLPVSPYGFSKLASEEIVLSYIRSYGIKGVIFRLFNVFGERQSMSAYTGVIPRFITALLNRKRPVIYGDGKQTRDFTYVANVVYAINLALLKMIEEDEPAICGKVINIGCGYSTSVLTLFELIREMVGKICRDGEVSSIEPVFEEPRKGDILHSMASIERARQLLGYKPVVDIREGLKKTIEHYYHEMAITLNKD